jgi:hypothetical protein
MVIFHCELLDFKAGAKYQEFVRKVDLVDLNFDSLKTLVNTRVSGALG